MKGDDLKRSMDATDSNDSNGDVMWMTKARMPRWMAVDGCGRLWMAVDRWPGWYSGAVTTRVYAALAPPSPTCDRQKNG